MERDPVIVAGFGYRRGATSQSLASALDKACATGRADALATVAEKAETAVFAAFVRNMKRPAIAISPADLAAQQTETQSAASLETHGTGSVAEAAALAAAGPDARLIRARVVSDDRMATCALAEGGPK